jgi:hypothetical protein
MELLGGYEYYFSQDFFQKVSQHTIPVITKTLTEKDVIDLMHNQARALYYVPMLNCYVN